MNSESKFPLLWMSWSLSTLGILSICRTSSRVSPMLLFRSEDISVFCVKKGLWRTWSSWWKSSLPSVFKLDLGDTMSFPEKVCIASPCAEFDGPSLEGLSVGSFLGDFWIFFSMEGLLVGSFLRGVRGNSLLNLLWDSAFWGELWIGSFLGELRVGSFLGKLWVGPSIGDVGVDSFIAAIWPNNLFEEIWVGSVLKGLWVDSLLVGLYFVH